MMMEEQRDSHAEDDEQEAIAIAADAIAANAKAKADADDDDEEEEQQEEVDEPESETQEEEVEGPDATHQLIEVEIEKTAKGLGLFFACLQQAGANGHDVLAVDGFVTDNEEEEEQQQEDNDEEDESTLEEVDLTQQTQPSDSPHHHENKAIDQHAVDTTNKRDKTCSTLSDHIRLGDILVGINDVNCEEKDVMEIVDLLRSTPLGLNTLRFRRVTSHDNNQDSSSKQPNDEPTTGATHQPGASIKQSFMGAFQRMKSKLKAELDHDDKQTLQQEQETKEYERQWLAEFERLRAQQETKWNTCTYSADEFCGFLYHSADQQQKDYLLREFPLLMEYWHQLDDRAIASLRIRPDWPAVSSGYDTALPYQDMFSHSVATEQVSPYARIEASPCLRELLCEFQNNFHWTANETAALAAELEIHQIFSCKELLDATAPGHAESLQFLRLVQQLSFPRISVFMWKTLLRHAQEINQRLEDQCILPPPQHQMA